MVVYVRALYRLGVISHAPDNFPVSVSSHRIDRHTAAWMVLFMQSIICVRVIFHAFDK